MNLYEDELSNINSQKQEVIVNDFKELNSNTNKLNDLILYVNIRSLNANINYLEIMIESMKTKPLIIVCTETYNLHYYEYYKLKDYKIYYNNSMINRNDGVVIYIKDGINEYTEIKESGEIKFLHSKLRVGKGFNLEISAVYRSHDIIKSDFIKYVKKYLDENKFCNNHIVVGDFNVNILDEDFANQEFLLNFLERGYEPCYKKITRPSDQNGKGSCIDNMFIKTDEIDYAAFRVNNFITDHYPLILAIKRVSNNTNENDNEKGKCDKQINYRKLRKIAKEVNWNNFICQDPNLMTDLLISEIRDCINLSTKLSSKNKDKNAPRKKWITRAIINSCLRKESLYKIWKLNPHNTTLKNEYMNYKKILDKVILDAKCKYDSNSLTKCTRNPRRFWKNIKKLIGKNKDKKNINIEYLIDEKGAKIVNRELIPEAMNDYFCNIGKKLSENIVNDPNDKVKLPKNVDRTILIDYTSVAEIKNIVKHMKIKSGGVDNINTRVIKEIINFIAEPLMILFNNCIEQAIWPDSLKKAEIVPIYKDKEKYKAENYRPISLTSNIAKLFEKIIYKRIYGFITKNKIISKNQFGFRKGMGTKDALHKLTSQLYSSIDQNIPTVVTFLDLAKAFDSVNHEILLKKLFRYGIRGKAYEIVQSYLTDRKQRVKINGNVSNYKDINIGVPQGTILGPLLFILYVNDILDDMPDDSIIAYADDTAVISCDNTWEKSVVKMNEYLVKIAKWLKLNKLTLNVNKTVYMTFGSYRISVPEYVEIRIEDKLLKRVVSSRYLGIIIDYNLKWKEHIEYVVKKSKYLVFIFYKLSKFAQTKALLQLYYAYFVGILNYGVIAWGGAYYTNVYPLQYLHNKILRIISKNKFINENYPLSLDQLYALEALTIHYEELSNKYRTSMSITRHKPIQLPNIDKTVYKNSTIVVATKAFNRLTVDLKELNIKNKSTKKKLKKWIQKNF